MIFLCVENMERCGVKISINLSAVALALIIMAVVSLLIMISLTQLDNLIHDNLSDFGLRFSYRWAMPYWVYSCIIISLSWFNIAASIMLTYYVFKKRKRSPRPEVQQAEKVETLAEESTEQPGELIETQILDYYCESPKLQITCYDVRHPEDVVDSQC